MLGEKESFNMMYIIIVLLTSIARGKSFPQRSHGYEGNYEYDPYHENFDFPDLHVKEYQLQMDPKPTPESRYSTYVPLIDGKPIYIPEPNEDLNIRDELHHNNPKRMKSKHSWGTDYENSAYHKHRKSHKKNYDTDDAKYRVNSAHERKRKRDHPTGYLVNRHSKPMFHKRPVVPAYIVPEEGYHTPVVQAVIPITHLKHVHPEEIAVREFEDDSVEEETFNKKEKHVTHKKPVLPEDILPEYNENGIPVVVEVLGRNVKPVKYEKPVHPEIIVPEYGYESSVVVEALTKKKPVNHVKPVYSQEIVAPDYDGYDTPVVVEALTKKKPVTHIKPVYPEEIIPEYDGYDAPVVVEALTKKKPVTHVKPVHPEEIVVPEYEGYDTPVVVEALARKGFAYETHVKPVAHVKHETHVKPEKHVKPVIHVKPEKHVKPVYPEEIVVPEYDGYDTPLVVEALTIKEKPVKPVTHAKPVYPEEIVIPKYDEYDTPVTETVTKKEKRAINFKPVTRVHAIPEYGYDVSQAAHSRKGKPTHAESLYVDDYGYNRPVDYGSHGHAKVEINIDGRVIDQSSEKSVDCDSHEHTEIEIPDVENIVELVIDPSSDEFVDGSGSISERSELPTPRSFLPVDPSVWSLMSNIHAQERQKFKRCLTPKNETGNCMPIQMCSVPNVASGIEELMNNVCVIDEVFIGICCPEFPVETVRVDWDQFEEDQHGETFNEDDSQEEKECGKLPSSIGKTVAWPWMAPLVAVSTGKVFCGGALINEQYVLSAAHCTRRIPRNRILVRLGPLDAEHEADHFEVTEIKRHAQYDSRSMLNDIALLKLSKRVPLSHFRRVICLPDDDDDDDDYVGETAILLRSQRFSEKTEELESLPVISNQECQNKMGVLTSDSILCTVPRKEETKCNDDSGAALVIGKDKQFKAVGILTWNRNDCDERFPSMFTRVSKYRKWIDNHAA